MLYANIGRNLWLIMPSSASEPHTHGMDRLSGNGNYNQEACEGTAGGATSSVDRNAPAFCQGVEVTERGAASFGFPSVAVGF